jgi:hypothetical protein
MTRATSGRALRAVPEPAEQTAPDDSRLLCTVTLGELGAWLDMRDAERAPVAASGPLLVSGAQLGRLLGCSRTQVHRLRLEGAPAVRLGDVFKYEPAAVLTWLRDRSGPR